MAGDQTSCLEETLDPVLEEEDSEIIFNSVLNGVEIQRITGDNANFIIDLGKKLLQYSKIGDEEKVKSLVSKGASFTTDWIGHTPLHLAVQHGHLEITGILLRAGISRDARTKIERTPLHLAVQNGYPEIAELLLSKGADIDAQDFLKMTPLHWAAETENLKCIEVLLSHGADVLAENKFDLTAYDIASNKGYSNICSMLESCKDYVHFGSLSVESNPVNDYNAEDELVDAPSEPVPKPAQQEEVKTTEAGKIALNLTKPSTSSFFSTTSTLKRKISKENTIQRSVTPKYPILGRHFIVDSPGKLPHFTRPAIMSSGFRRKISIKENNGDIYHASGKQINSDEASNHSSAISQLTLVPISKHRRMAEVQPVPNIKSKVPLTSVTSKANYEEYLQPKKNSTSSACSATSSQPLALSKEQLSRQLEEARKDAEKFRKQLKQKENEAEEYRKKLASLLTS